MGKVTPEKREVAGRLVITAIQRLGPGLATVAGSNPVAGVAALILFAPALIAVATAAGLQSRLHGFESRHSLAAPSLGSSHTGECGSALAAMVPADAPALAAAYEDPAIQRWHARRCLRAPMRTSVMLDAFLPLGCRLVDKPFVLATPTVDVYVAMNSARIDRLSPDRPFFGPKPSQI
jgi:hypothetical protein